MANLLDNALKYAPTSTGIVLRLAYDTTSVKRVDANTTEQVRKKEGKMVQTATRKISADGKTMTVTTRGKDEAGRTLNTVAVYDKQ